MRPRILVAVGFAHSVLLLLPVVSRLPSGARLDAPCSSGRLTLPGFPEISVNLGRELLAEDAGGMTFPEGTDESIKNLLRKEPGRRERAFDELRARHHVQIEALRRILENSADPEAIHAAIELLSIMGDAGTADILASRFLTFQDPGCRLPAGTSRTHREQQFPALGALIAVGAPAVEALAEASTSVPDDDRQRFQHVVYVLDQISWRADVVPHLRSLRRTTYTDECRARRLDELIAALERKQEERALLEVANTPKGDFGSLTRAAALLESLCRGAHPSERVQDLRLALPHQTWSQDWRDRVDELAATIRIREKWLERAETELKAWRASTGRLGSDADEQGPAPVAQPQPAGAAETQAGALRGTHGTSLLPTIAVLIAGVLGVGTGVAVGWSLGRRKSVVP